MAASCPRGKVRNPKTNRCVKKTGKIGRAILSRRPPRKHGGRSQRDARTGVKPGDRKFFRMRDGGYDAYVARRRSGKLVWVHNHNSSRTRKIGR